MSKGERGHGHALYFRRMKKDKRAKKTEFKRDEKQNMKCFEGNRQTWRNIYVNCLIRFILPHYESAFN